MADLREWAGVGVPDASFEADWDWYAASLASELDGPSVVDSLRVAIGDVEVRRSPGRHGFALRDEFMRGRRVVAGVSYGGGQPRTFVESSGGSAVSVAGVVRCLYPLHRVTRADSAWDVEGPSAWGDLKGLAMDVAHSARVSTSVAGDWLDKVRGRTLYIGAPTSPVRMRIYEKGIQLPELKRPNWVRCELVVRPEKLAREALAHLDAVQAWGSSRWSRAFVAGAVGLDLEPVRMKQWQEPDDARARGCAMRQYGETFRRWCEEYGGDWATWGRMIGGELERL